MLRKLTTVIDRNLICLLIDLVCTELLLSAKLCLRAKGYLHRDQSASRSGDLQPSLGPGLHDSSMRRPFCRRL